VIVFVTFIIIILVIVIVVVTICLVAMIPVNFTRELTIDMVNISASITGLVHVVDANLRNGAIGNISAPSRASAIEAMWVWAEVAHGRRDAAVGSIGGWIATAYGYIGEATVDVPELDATGAAANQTAGGGNGFSAQVVPGPRLGGTAADWQPFVDQAAANASIRRRAIVLGSARASISAAYSIDDPDLLPNESTNATIWTATGRDAAGGVVVADPANGIAVEAVRFSSTHTSAAGNLTFAEALGDAMDDLTNDEMEYSFAIYRLAMAAPPLSGLSLYKSKHHFLSSDTRAIQAIEGQVLGESNDVVKTWYKDNEDEIRDVLWHKSIHPIRPELLKAWSCSAETKLRLQAMDLDAAAVRLPYLEPALQAARAYIVTVDTVASWAASKGHTVGVSGLEAAVAAAEAMPRTGQVSPYTGAPPMTREQFINEELAIRVNKALHVIGWAYGVILAMVDAGQLELRRLSISTAKSVLRLQRSRAGDIAQGREAYDNGRRYERNQADRGKFTTVIMIDT
jgi:hypothetical protein